MSLKRFWLFSESIDRMNAEQDIRSSRVAASVLDGDSYTESMQSLSDTVGTVAVRIFLDKDSESIERLKQLMI